MANPNKLTLCAYVRKSSLLFHGSFKQSLNESWWYLESYVLYCDECLSGSKSPSLARRSSDVKCNEYTLLLLFKIRQDCCSHHGNAIVALDDSLTEQLWKWNIRFLFVVKEHFLFSWQILWREWHKSIWAKIVLENVYWHATNVINKKLITLNYYIWQWLAIILFLYLSSNYLYKARDFKYRAGHWVFVRPAWPDGTFWSVPFGVSF